MERNVTFSEHQFLQALERYKAARTALAEAGREDSAAAKELHAAATALGLKIDEVIK